jgi:hypothetical protein
MLIISFLPLGYTLKGKFLLVLTSFILSLGGLASVSIFPLWQTSLMLFALIFFAVYFINNRMGSFVFKEIPVYEEVFEGEFEKPETDYIELESLKDVNVVDIDGELSLTDISYKNKEKETAIELSPSPVISSIEELTDNESETIDEDISFLLERNTEEAVNEQIEVTNLDNGYLSDIESLLELESEQENLHELSPIIVKDKFTEQLDEDEEEPLNDSLFDFLLAQKEVTADRDEILDEIETKEKVSLQK